MGFLAARFAAAACSGRQNLSWLKSGVRWRLLYARAPRFFREPRRAHREGASLFSERSRHISSAIAPRLTARAWLRASRGRDASSAVVALPFFAISHAARV